MEETEHKEKTIREREMEQLMNMDAISLGKVVQNPTDFFAATSGRGSEEISTPKAAFFTLVTLLSRPEREGLENYLALACPSLYLEIVGQSGQQRIDAIDAQLDTTDDDISLSSSAQKTPEIDDTVRKTSAQADALLADEDNLKTEGWTKDELSLYGLCLRTIVGQLRHENSLFQLKTWELGHSEYWHGQLNREIQIFQHRGNFDSYDSAEIFMVSASPDDFNHTDVLSSMSELKKKEIWGSVLRLSLLEDPLCGRSSVSVQRAEYQIAQYLQLKSEAEGEGEGGILERAENELESLSKNGSTKKGFFQRMFSKNDDWTRHELAVFLKCIQHILLVDGEVDENEMELMKIEMRKAEVLGDFRSEAELSNFFDVSKNISQEEIELCLSKLSDTKKQVFKEALMNMAQVDGRMTAHEDMAIKIFSDYMS